MLAIRSEQVAVFETVCMSAFVERAKTYIRTHFPDAAEEFGEDELETLARQAIGRGALYGMSGERYVLQILILMLLFGIDFDLDLPESAEIAGVLGNEASDADNRLDRVFSLLSPRLESRA